MQHEKTMAELRALASRGAHASLPQTYAREALDLGEQLFRVLDGTMRAQDMLAAQAIPAAAELMRLVTMKIATLSGAHLRPEQRAELYGLVMQTVTAAIYDPRWRE